MFSNFSYSVLWFLVFVASTIQKQRPDLCKQLPASDAVSCQCETIRGNSQRLSGIHLQCHGLLNFNSLYMKEKIQSQGSNSLPTSDSSSNSNLEQILTDETLEIVVRDSNLTCVDLVFLADKYRHLQKLAVIRSNLEMIKSCKLETPVVSDSESNSRIPEADLFQSSLESNLSTFPSLEILDFSSNRLKKVEKIILDRFPAIRELNLSGNAIDTIDSYLFSNLPLLKVLDLSSNMLNHHVDPQTFINLPPGFHYIDISENSWTCSPKLAWMYNWSIPLILNGALAKVNSTRCQYEGSFYYAKLLLVMEFYSNHVLPSCPAKDGCQCFIENIQEKIVVSTERHYAVFVSCPNNQLAYFPKLPKHTRTLDLSGNKLTNEAFKTLKLSENNYNEVENLTLNDNLLESLPESLLEMKLGISFKAKRNHLSTISYDFSQRLLKSTNIIELGDNPWVCSCTSQITDLNLLSKIKDKKNMNCGPGSDSRLIDKQIYSLGPEDLCPPDTYGDEYQELQLEILCVILIILIMAILSKLTYDGWIYRTRGQLPWLVLKIP